MTLGDPVILSPKPEFLGVETLRDVTQIQSSSTVYQQPHYFVFRVTVVWYHGYDEWVHRSVQVVPSLNSGRGSKSVLLFTDTDRRRSVYVVLDVDKYHDSRSPQDFRLQPKVCRYLGPVGTLLPPVNGLRTSVSWSG